MRGTAMPAPQGSSIPNAPDIYYEAFEAKSQGEPSARGAEELLSCLLYTSPSPRDRTRSRMPSSA